jgi:hypothetical protein
MLHHVHTHTFPSIHKNTTLFNLENNPSVIILMKINQYRKIEIESTSITMYMCVFRKMQAQLLPISRTKPNKIKKREKNTMPLVNIIRTSRGQKKNKKYNNIVKIHLKYIKDYRTVVFRSFPLLSLSNNKLIDTSLFCL